MRTELYKITASVANVFTHRFKFNASNFVEFSPFRKKSLFGVALHGALAASCGVEMTGMSFAA
jgi:hypothetical protein